MKVYMIPGLGADKRMYEAQLALIPNAEILEHLPTVKGETLGGYAARLAPLIDDSDPFVIIGTSLGGMIAIELLKHVRPVKVILIASVKTRSELPAFIRSMRYLKLHKLVNGEFYKKFNNLLAVRLDNRSDSPAAELIRQMSNDASSEFINWAVNAVINWQPEGAVNTKLIHIHGTADKLFPIKGVSNPVVIKNGTHIMNITMSDEVNKALVEALAG